MKAIGYIHSDFPTKFGVPRQSRLVENKAQIILTPPYNQADAVRGLEAFSHIWIIWQFSENLRKDGSFAATVRPPRLGGNTRLGVFATRSPFRPNPVGLSCVKLEKITFEEGGPVLHVIGADMVDGTPVFDIKPYVAYTDSIPDAEGGFSDAVKDYEVKVEIPAEELAKISPDQREILRDILTQDPRPSYQDDEDRVYGMAYGNMEIKFTVSGGVLTVRNVDAD